MRRPIRLFRRLRVIIRRNNNVNKKFVISEIDTNYLSTGITLTKQSRG